MGLSELIKNLQQIEQSLGNVEVYAGSMEMFSDDMQNAVMRVVVSVDDGYSSPAVILITE